MSNSFSSENRIFIGSSFRQRLRAQFENFFLFSSCAPVSIMVRVFFFYGRRSRSFFNIRRILVREIFSWTANFRLATFFFRFKWSFTFSIDSLVRMIGEQLGNVDSLIEPISRIILQHHLTVRRHNAPFKCQNSSDVPSHFSYFESISFCNCLLFIVEEKN